MGESKVFPTPVNVIIITLKCVVQCFGSRMNGNGNEMAHCNGFRMCLFRRDKIVILSKNNSEICFYFFILNELNRRYNQLAGFSTQFPTPTPPATWKQIRIILTRHGIPFHLGLSIFVRNVYFCGCAREHSFLWCRQTFRDVAMCLLLETFKW